MSETTPKPESKRRSKEGSDIFLKHIITLIKNLLIDNKNYHNDYFNNPGYTAYNLRHDTIERANFILEEIDKTKHLVESPPDVLEKIIKDILKHDEEHPNHGIGCACMDQHSGAIRRLMGEYNLRFKDNPKSTANFKRVLSYILR